MFVGVWEVDELEDDDEKVDEPEFGESLYEGDVFIYLTEEYENSGQSVDTNAE